MLTKCLSAFSCITFRLFGDYILNALRVCVPVTHNLAHADMHTPTSPVWVQTSPLTRWLSHFTLYRLHPTKKI